MDCICYVTYYNNPIPNIVTLCSAPSLPLDHDIIFSDPSTPIPIDDNIEG